MKSRLKVNSQQELARLVLRRLKKHNKDYKLTAIRTKRIALEIPGIEVKAKTKKTLKVTALDFCPVCESDVKTISVKNLLNKDTLVGFECTKCGYESDLEAFVPMKYSFVLKQ